VIQASQEIVKQYKKWVVSYDLLSEEEKAKPETAANAKVHILPLYEIILDILWIFDDNLIKLLRNKYKRAKQLLSMWDVKEQDYAVHRPKLKKSALTADTKNWIADYAAKELPAEEDTKEEGK
jgi:hypothetical protein